MSSVELPGVGAARADGTASSTPSLNAQVCAFLKRLAAAESGRLFLWTPVAVGAGAATYLTLPFEPPVALAPLVGLAAFAVAVLVERLRVAAAAVALIALGVLAAERRADQVAGPILAREISPRAMTGRILTIDEFEGSRRYVVALSSINGLSVEETPRRVRITWKGAAAEAAPGDLVAFRAGLLPPPPPAAPGGFDFARQLYFQKIGALGFAVTAPKRIVEDDASLADQWRGVVEKLRLTLTRRILDAAPGEGGAFVAASITGKRAAISEETYKVLRDSGLAHLIAISGLNMAIVTGLVFFAARLALAASEPIALRFPIKKVAALAALGAGLFYLILAGSEWSAERAFIMSAIMLTAILFDRRAFTLRNVAIAALAILLLTPEAVVHPGFQMSFAATTALIAAYEWGARRLDPDRSFAWPAKVRRYFVGIIATDLIASTATSPFSLFHFSRVAVLGLPANIVAVPLTGFVIMPLSIAALALAPLGLDAPCWRLAGAGAELVLGVGRFVGGLPGAVATIPHWPPAALVVLSLGGLWLCLQSASWRWLGLAAVPIAALFVAAAPSPVLFLTADGDNAGAIVQTDQGRALAMFNPRKDKFEAEVFKEFVGLDPDATPTLPMRAIGRCDDAGCVVSVEGRGVAISGDPMSLAADCARADLIVALYPVSRSDRGCNAFIIDRRDAWNEGAHSLWFTRDGRTRVRSARDANNWRPWQAGRATTRPETSKSAPRQSGGFSGPQKPQTEAAAR